MYTDLYQQGGEGLRESSTSPAKSGSPSSSNRGSIQRARTAARGAAASNVSDAAIILNLAQYAARNGQLFAEGQRVLPVTLSGLQHARQRRRQLERVEAPRGVLSSFSAEPPAVKEKRELEELFKCFRSTQALRVTQGSGAEQADVDLSGFNSLRSLEFCGVRLTAVHNAPLGVRDLLLTQGSVVPLEQLGEGIMSLSLDACRELCIGTSTAACLAPTLRTLTVKTSLFPPRSLHDIVGSVAEWPALRKVRVVSNVLDMDETLTNLAQVTSLNLANNGILRVACVATLSHLTSLDLSNNEIASLVATRPAEDGSEDLVSVNLLPPTLVSLSVARNRLVSLCGVFDLPHLQVLDASHNQLRSWNEVYHIMSSRSPKLRSLSLHGNTLLRQAIRQYRPLVAGMIDIEKWKSFQLDGKPLNGVDINRNSVRQVCVHYQEFFKSLVMPQTTQIIQEAEPTLRSRNRAKHVDLEDEDEDELPDEARRAAHVGRTCAVAAVAVIRTCFVDSWSTPSSYFCDDVTDALAASTASILDKSHASSPDGRRKTKKKIIRRVVKRRIGPDGNAEPDPPTPRDDGAGDTTPGASQQSTPVVADLSLLSHTMPSASGSLSTSAFNDTLSVTPPPRNSPALAIARTTLSGVHGGNTSVLSLHERTTDDEGLHTSSHSHSQSQSQTPCEALSPPRVAGFFETVEKSLSDSNPEGHFSSDGRAGAGLGRGSSSPRLTGPAGRRLTLDDEHVQFSTGTSFRTLVEEAAARISKHLSAGTVTPELTEVSVRRHPWGDVRVQGTQSSQPPFHVSLLPPNSVADRGDARRLVAVDACNTDGAVFLRVRSAPAAQGRSAAAARAATQSLLQRVGGAVSEGESGDDLRYGFAATPREAGPPGVITHDGFGVRYAGVFPSHGVSELSTASVQLANVQTWEVGEAKPWDPKRVTVDPTPGAQYVTTYEGVTYMPRRQQSNVKAAFHFYTDAVLLAGFEVADKECEDILVDLLRSRINVCRLSPQWPVVTSTKQGAATSLQKTFKQFQIEVGKVEPLAVEDLRAGSRLHEGTQTANDVFLYFGSTIAGHREPDYELLAKEGIRKRVHIPDIINPDPPTQGEQLAASCYCNALLGNSSHENEEKSCWIAVSGTHTYFCLDLNYLPRTGRPAKQPFSFLACHKNSDLAKVELGFSWQYMRLVYGGDSGTTYMLLPRSKQACVVMLGLLTTAKGASATGMITQHSSPFAARPLVPGMGQVKGYFLVFIRQSQLVQRRKGRETAMCFAQDAYPVREMTGGAMIPVSVVVTKDELLLTSDRYASWPDGENDPARWHLEKRASLGDVVGLWVADARSQVHPSRFDIEFESDIDERSRWKLAAQTPEAMREATMLIKTEYENKWGGGGAVKMAIEALTAD